jgi:hypothetical protein
MNEIVKPFSDFTIPPSTFLACYETEHHAAPSFPDGAGMIPDGVGYGNSDKTVAHGPSLLLGTRAA